VKFLLRVTLRWHDLAAETYHIKEPQQLPLIMSCNEAERLLAMAGGLKIWVMLALGYGCHVMLPLAAMVEGAANALQHLRATLGPVAVPRETPGQAHDHPSAQPPVP
jgi:hypothetical protein